MTCYGVVSYGGYDSYEEAVAELEHCLKQGVAEGWSEKYKRSINCSHPKGFSQKAHCAGKKKHSESVEMEMTCPDCGMSKNEYVAEVGPRAVDDQGNPIIKPKGHSVSTPSEPYQMKSGDSYSTSKGVVTKTDTGIIHKGRKDITPKPRGVAERIGIRGLGEHRAPKPTNELLWKRALTEASNKFDKLNPLRSSWAAKWYKAHGGTWKK
jgi:rubredoxin